MTTTTFTPTSAAEFYDSAIESSINESFDAYQLEIKRQERFRHLMKQIDTEAIEKFLYSKGLNIIRCNIEHFCRPSLTANEKLTEEFINNAQIRFAFLLDATNFKAIKQCKFRGYGRRGSSLNDKVRNEKARKFEAMVSEKFPALRITTNEFSFEYDSHSEEKPYRILLSISTKA